MSGLRTIEDLSRMFNPIIRGWIQYYGSFYKSELYGVLRHINRALVHWARRKFKKLARYRRRAEHWMGRLAQRQPGLLAHWQMGILPAVEQGEPDEPRGSRPVLRGPRGATPIGANLVLAVSESLC